MATLFRLEASTPADLPALTAELAALLPPGEEPELRRDFTSWLIHLLRRMRPGVTIPEVGKLEEIAMLEETLTEWMNGATERGQVEGIRRVLLRQLEQRFETVPLQVRRRVEAIQSAQKLEELAGRVLVVRSLEEMGLG